MISTLPLPDLRGLSPDEARQRLVTHGPNALPDSAGIGIWQRIARQFQSALIYILLCALALDIVLWVSEGAKDLPFEAIAIALILVLNAGLGVYQESKAEEALARLKAMALPAAWVMRGGVLTQISANEIVPGDIVRIEAGDRVPADGRLVSGEGVMVDQSILSGESLPVDKEHLAELFSGTLVVRSKGQIEVSRTGPRSSMGRLATMLGGIDASQTPLERRLGEFGNQIAGAILALGAVLILGGVMVEGTSHLGQIVLFAVALAVAAVPEGLPAVLTLTLAMGVERLAKRKAVVRRLSAVEALGSVTVIATDKTGTLTENRMHVRGVDAPDAERAMRAMILANDAELATGAGDPLEVALLNYAVGQGADPAGVVAAAPRLSSSPFDSVTKFMRVTVGQAGRHVSYLKGAPEVLIERSTLTAEQKCEWEGKALEHARAGYRVLALGWREHETAVASDQDLTFLGLVMLWDPPRPEVRDALARAKAAGIRVMMLTGDHPATAKAIGDVIGITSERVVTGRELETMTAEQVLDVVAHVNVFARVEPQHKLRLVEALKDNGEIVAVTGDGINDAPALKRSDVGIAMGLRGSDVSREVADVVLLDDNFATIVTAIEEGRNIYENIQKFIRFFFSTDLALIALMMAGLAIAFLFGLKDPSGATFLLPLTAVQLLWINVVADGPPALALAFDVNPGVMNRPPRPPRSKLLDSAAINFILVSATAKVIGGIAVFVAMPWFGHSMDETRTALFIYEAVLQLVFIYPVRRVGLPPAFNAWVHWAIGFGLVLQALTLLFAPLRSLLGLVPLSAPALGAVLAAVLVTWAIAEWFVRRKA